MRAEKDETIPTPIRTGVKPSKCGTYFIWAAADANNQILVCATCALRADACAQADIWKGEFDTHGDPRTATTKIMAIRTARAAETNGILNAAR